MKYTEEEIDNVGWIVKPVSYDVGGWVWFGLVILWVIYIFA